MRNSLKSSSFFRFNIVFLIFLSLEFVFINVSFADSKLGRKTYKRYCVSCHLSGSSGAPRFKRQKDWNDRLSKGRQTLYKHSIEGFGKMEAKGGFKNLSDKEVKFAVDYMLDSLLKPPPK